tara:strand:- start:3135 stop:4475 length:1341 start_codon:yes stop_codon:yes gene_type:complete
MTNAQSKIQETTLNVQSFANDYVSHGVANENNKSFPRLKDFPIFNGQANVYCYAAFGYRLRGYIKSYIYHYVRQFGAYTATQIGLSQLLGASLSTIEKLITTIKPLTKENLEKTSGILIKSHGLVIAPLVVKYFGITFASILARTKLQELRSNYCLSGRELSKEISVSVSTLKRTKTKYFEFFKIEEGFYEIDVQKVSDFISEKEAQNQEKLHPKTRKNDTTKPEKCYHKPVKMTPTYIEQISLQILRQKEDSVVEAMDNSFKKDSLPPTKKSREQVPKETLTKEKPPCSLDVIQAMLNHWNNIRGVNISLTDCIAQKLGGAYYRKCDKDMEKWIWYVKNVPSDYDICDALVFKIMDQIFFKEISKKIENTQAQLMDEKIKNLEEPEEIKKIRFSILKKIGSAEYFSWFHLAKIEMIGSNINLTANNRFAFSYWENNYPWALKGKI